MSSGMMSRRTISRNVRTVRNVRFVRFLSCQRIDLSGKIRSLFPLERSERFERSERLERYPPSGFAPQRRRHEVELFDRNHLDVRQTKRSQLRNERLGVSDQ